MPGQRNNRSRRSPSRHRASSEFVGPDWEASPSPPRITRQGRSRSGHRPAPEFHQGNVQMIRPSLLSFPITEPVSAEPIVARRADVRRRRDAHQTAEEVRRPEETERATGEQAGLVTKPEDWAELSMLEERGKKEKKTTIRPDGAEVVLPHRWPADQGPTESLEAYESRLAEYELEMFLNSKEPMTTVALERARAKQRKALRERSEKQWTANDIESQTPVPQMRKLNSPQPGPPTEPERMLGARPKEKQGSQVRDMNESQRPENRERRLEEPVLNQRPEE
ncbi:uncharacterized protein LOC122504063 [Leptopilina heterotoma]|uniref:uncharacterized protein LOC122504063 n=1 Tax=Leptopilina heterotoma TaxID=63436 RepID=UPI001CA9A968|nr:uncharacterized protein LOC122504063 [Leptopilina heterotoma]